MRLIGLDELWVRGRQEASKWLERTGALTPTRGDALALDVDRVRALGQRRFFEGAVSERAAWSIDRMAGVRDAIVETADAACDGRFDLLGYSRLSFGDPVDWHLDPISGRRAPLAHWSRLNVLDAAQVGDHKVVWELNRHQWLVALGQAYRLTGDQRYGEAFARYVREWLRANPGGMGVNWASSLEVALRLIAWCWALFLFRGSRALSRELGEAMLGAMWAHAAHVERYLSSYFSPNTHLTGEALGLFYAGVVLAEGRRAPRWRRRAADILVRQSERQILPDGVYFEQSTCYQRYSIEIYLHFLVLAARSGVAVPAVVGERVQRMLDFLLAVRRPDGSVPSIGDADGGWLLPFTRRAPGDARGVFSTAAVWFRRPDYAWAAGGLAPETLWLLGPAAAPAFDALAAKPPAQAPSRLFAEGGYAVMRGGWAPDAHHLVFDVGPLGCPVSGGHGHADLLGIQASPFGTRCLADCGTYGYTLEPAWRNFFRSTAAHSTLTVDGAGHAAPAGPFAWHSRPRARLRAWLSTEAVDFADAEHDAYRGLADPVTHRRRVVFVKPRFWVIVDDLAGAAEHCVEARFQFAPIDVTLEPTGWARARGADGRGVLLRAFATVPLKTEIREGELAPIQGWISRDYGLREPAPVLVCSAVTRLPLRILTVMLPTENPLASPPPVSAVLGTGHGPAGLILGHEGELVVIGERNAVVVPADREGRSSR
jgi:heparinase II/III-like protein